MPAAALLLLAACAASSAESDRPALRPSFPNHALALLPTESVVAATGRAGPAGPVDTELPFSWNQVAVIYEGATNLRYLGGFDPGFQPVLFEILPSQPQNVRVDYVDGQLGLVQITALGQTGGLQELFSFRVRARDVTNDEVFTLTYDIRDSNTRIRGQPFLTRSPGDFIRPGQIVRYTWTRTGGGERRPKVEAEFTGRTGQARGLRTSAITEVQAIKVQPFVLGHYLMMVTPRDVRGEPPRGSTSNGQVFRCAFGSENLAPATDGCASDTFIPAVGQTITIQPVAVDPETARATFDNQTYDFGDGTVVTGVSGPATHAYAVPGIYRVRCTLADDLGATATAEDTVVVGATDIPKFSLAFVKQIPPEEAGIGALANDNLTMTFKGASAQAGDRILFSFNRNRFGRVHASDGDDTDIVLKAGGGFSGQTPIARNVTVQGGPNAVSVSVSGAQFDRTGDPRFGRADLKGIFTNQRIALCVIPATGETPRVYLYRGNVDIRVKGGQGNRAVFIPEESVRGKATTKEPDPRKQEIP